MAASSETRTETVSAFPEAGGCACYEGGARCVCSQDERALRNIAYKMLPSMTAEQREFCLREIEQVEGWTRADHEQDSDSSLASATLSAWRDYCRDKGFSV